MFFYFYFFRLLMHLNEKPKNRNKQRIPHWIIDSRRTLKFVILVPERKQNNHKAIKTNTLQ